MTSVSPPNNNVSFQCSKDSQNPHHTRKLFFFASGTLQNRTSAIIDTQPQHVASHIMPSAVKLPHQSFTLHKSRYQSGKWGSFTVGGHTQSTVGIPQQAAASSGVSSIRSSQGSPILHNPEEICQEFSTLRDK